MLTAQQIGQRLSFIFTGIAIGMGEFVQGGGSPEDLWLLGVDLGFDEERAVETRKSHAREQRREREGLWPGLDSWRKERLPAAQLRKGLGTFNETGIRALFCAKYPLPVFRQVFAQLVHFTDQHFGRACQFLRAGT